MVISSAALELPANKAIEPASTTATRYCIVASLGIEFDFPSLRVGTGGRHRPALDESLRLDVGSMTPFLSDFLPRSEATKQSIFSLRRWIAGAPGKLAWSCRRETGPGRPYRAPGSESCVVAGDAGREAAPAIVGGGRCSPAT